MCPGEVPSFRWQVATSPEFEAQLRQIAPAGTSEGSLILALVAQGFDRDQGPCSNDPAVNSATFTQRGGGLSSYPVMATAYWRVDVNQNIEWVHGTVAYTGP